MQYRTRPVTGHQSSAVIPSMVMLHTLLSSSHVPGKACIATSPLAASQIHKAGVGVFLRPPCSLRDMLVYKLLEGY